MSVEFEWHTRCVTVQRGRIDFFSVRVHVEIFEFFELFAASFLDSSRFETVVQLNEWIFYFSSTSALQDQKHNRRGYEIFVGHTFPISHFKVRLSKQNKKSQNISEFEFETSCCQMGECQMLVSFFSSHPVHPTRKQNLELRSKLAHWFSREAKGKTRNDEMRSTT